MKEALYTRSISDSKVVQCLLCPNECKIPEGKAGICRVRRNEEGKLYTVIGDRCCSVQIDPIEKKPLYHFNPGSRILSLGTFGCNFSCVFCQNWSLSQADAKYLTPEGISQVAQKITSEEALSLIKSTRDKGNIGIAYTYNEPSIWFEFVRETAQLVHENGFVNVLVSNGYLKEEPLREILPYIDAANIDIKSINPEFYKKHCHARLEPVLEYCRIIREHALLEVTNLIIPTLNDSDKDLNGLVDWVAENLGADVPIHFSRYHPDYELGIKATPVETLERAYEIAIKKLKYVYVGNVMNDDWNNTLCPKCKKPVIEREGMGVSRCSLTEDGECKFCREKIRIAGTCKQSW